MKLTGSQRKELRDALLDAYPTPSKLDEMVSIELNKNLWALAMGDDLKAIIFKLIKTAETEGWVKQLIEAAYSSNDGNEMLKTFYKKYLQKQEIQLQNAEVPPQDTILGNIPTDRQRILKDDSVKTALPFRSSTTANEKNHSQFGATANGQKTERQQQSGDEELRVKREYSMPYWYSPTNW